MGDAVTARISNKRKAYVLILTNYMTHTNTILYGVCILFMNIRQFLSPTTYAKY